MPLPERPVDPDWLALREPADRQARDRAAGFLLPLTQRLGQQGMPRRRLRVVDLGSGTGANLRWLAPRLADLGVAAAADQRWTLIDHDPRLHPWGPAPGESVGGPAVTTVHADVLGLSRILSLTGGADLVTAAALLDLLDGPRLRAVVDAVVAHASSALFSLSVTGAVDLDPADPLDDALAAAFDAHQRREGRLGPDAGSATVAAFARHGWSVLEAATPWVLAPTQGGLIDAWLVGRVEAAVEWQPALAAPAAAWLARRRRQWRRGMLGVRVHHVDLLALPDPDPTDA